MAGFAHVFLPLRGNAVGVQPQRKRGLERDERPLAFPQYRSRSFARGNQLGPHLVREAIGSGTGGFRRGRRCGAGDLRSWI